MQSPAIRCVPLLLLAAGAPFHCGAQNIALPFQGAIQPRFSPASPEKLTAIFGPETAPIAHFAGLTPESLRQSLADAKTRKVILSEQLADRWFAALVSSPGAEESRIVRRFPSWLDLAGFLESTRALVEVRTIGADGARGRRLTSSELAETEAAQGPRAVDVVYSPHETDEPVTNRLEFSFQAAARVAQAQRAYSHHRRLQLAALQTLSARDSQGRPNARRQWEAIRDAVNEGALSIEEMPAPPANSADLFGAFEFETDPDNNFLRAVRVFRESEIRRGMLREAGADQPVLFLRRPGEKAARIAKAYQARDFSGELVPAPGSIGGQDDIQLRIVDPSQGDVRRWHTIEFGEPELLRQSGLARFALISASLERRRKLVALQKANLDRIVEPIIAALNVAGGATAAGFPIGDAARLAYNLASQKYISPVPSASELRELFAMMAARDRDAKFRVKPAKYLSAQDIAKLKSAGAGLSDRQVQDYLEQISEEDLEGMLWLARMRMVDARITNLLNILGGIGKLTGMTESGVLRDIFNNPYFSVSGDLSIKTILSMALGAKVTTPFSGVALDQLIEGRGPALAWLQYFDFSVDLRALINTAARWSKPDLARKELDRPFPYALRASDLAAYEFRIFGFPLLLFYKRGLIKADYEAYERDYAYGLLGARLIEHFSTKDEMDEEIRAGRMAPLGYVRVPDGKGHWKETNLAVFAHRIPAGKYRGRTSLIIYGLKAYEAHSQLMDRELLRFREFEKALEEGGVVEQTVDAANRREVPGTEFEPRFSTGSIAAGEKFTPLLAGLLELRRYWRMKAWGHSFTPGELAETASIFEGLAARGITLEDGDALLAIDPFHSAFIYRHRTAAGLRVSKVTRIPSFREIAQAAEQSEMEEQIEERRRQALAEGRAGIVWLNEARPIEGGFEAGPLLSAAAVSEIVGAAAPLPSTNGLDWIERLPVRDRARLERNHYAATVIEPDGGTQDGSRRFILTVEFPPGPAESESVNPVSGETMRNRYENGLWLSSITDHWIREMEYDSWAQERQSKTYINEGSRASPVKGPVLEETRTLEWWTRDAKSASLDPYLPSLVKAKVNYFTGRVSAEVYGSFPLPVRTIDDQSIADFRFNRYGLPAEARTLENGTSPADFQRPPGKKLREPVEGIPRFVMRTTLPGLDHTASFAPSGFRTSIETTDLAKNIKKTVLLENGWFGRKIAESYDDVWEGTNAFPAQVTNLYTAGFCFGLVPVASQVRSGQSGKIISEIKMLEYTAEDQKLRGVRIQEGGQTQTNTWEARWQNPVEVRTGLRREYHHYNETETEDAGWIEDGQTGERLADFTARYSTNSAAWTEARRVWHRTGILRREETNIFSAFGKLISSEAGEVFLVRPGYDADGIETNRIVWSRGPGGLFNVRFEEQDDYRWGAEGCDLRVKTFIEGRPHDLFRRLNDSAGRTVLDRRREAPGCESKAVFVYENGSERWTSNSFLQNGQLRESRQVVEELPGPGDVAQLKVRIIPAWGLASTQTFLAGDVRGRPLETVYENGVHAVVSEWFQDSAVPRTVLEKNRFGRVIRQSTQSPGAGEERGIAYDLWRGAPVSFWGQTGEGEAIGMVRGTGIPLFRDSGRERIYYDPGQVYPVPRFAIDPSGRRGVEFQFGGQREFFTTAAFSFEVKETNRVSGAESLLVVDRVELDGIFGHEVVRQTFDRAGNILREEAGRIGNPGGQGYSDQWLAESTRRLPVTKRFEHLYEPGWLIETVEGKTGTRALVFKTNPPPARANFERVNAGLREIATKVRARQEPAREELDYSNLRGYEFERLHSRKELEQNPHLPGQAGPWIAWAKTGLGPDGKALFDSEIIFDGQGRLVFSKTSKKTAAGAEGFKISFGLFPPPVDKMVEMGAEKPIEVRRGPRQTESSVPDFFYFFLAGPASSAGGIGFRNERGRKLLVLEGARGESGSTSSLATNQWFPSREAPKSGLAFRAPENRTGERVFVIPANVLGLNPAAMPDGASISISASGSQSSLDRVSPLYPLVTGEKFSDPFLAEPASSILEHDSGITVVTGGAGKNVAASNRSLNPSVLGWDGLTLGITRARTRHSGFGEMVVMDDSNRDGPRPLYAISLRDGHFLERYLVVNSGEARVYTIVSGFDTPKYEVYRPGFLGDEISPGRLAYGYDYPVEIEVAKGHGLPARPLAMLVNRVSANGFRLAGRSLLGWIKKGTRERELSTHFDYVTLHSADKQAEMIDKLPLLAEGVLARRKAPWLEREPAPPNRPRENEGPPLGPPRYDRRAVALGLLELHVRKNLLPGTGLIPTSLGTDVERYVETVPEGELITLASKLGEFSLARELLDFYRQKFHQDREPLHASYDARAGTAMARNSLYQRPHPAPRTAAAQLAIAESAFSLGLATKDPAWIGFGQEILSVLLKNFRAAPGGPEPRGVAEELVLDPQPSRNPVLWPAPRRYSVADNARLYLLLERIKNQASDDDLFRPNWKEEVAKASIEQGEWLKKYLLPTLERTGLPPSGVFEIQDIPQKRTAMAAERWTSAQAWLDSIEVLDAMGFPRARLDQWLDNLARVHGVRIHGVWGLAPGLPLLSPDAISTELTARFYRLALQLNHESAAQLARRSLASLGPEGKWPILFSAAAPAGPYSTGQGQDWYPVTQKWTWQSRQTQPVQPWPLSLAIYNAFEEFGNAKARFSAGPASPPEPEEPSRPDLVIFLTVTVGFYLSILLVAIFWWQFRRFRRGKTDIGDAGLVVSGPVMQKAEERWARRVLGVRQAAGADHTRYSNGPVEMNFQMQLRAIYKLVLEWRRRENGWANDDVRLVEDETDDWLNGLDAFVAGVGLYMRFVIKAGAKDGFQSTDVFEQNEDSNHIWSRLVMYFSEYYWGLLGLLLEYQAQAGYQEKSRLYGAITALLADMGVVPRVQGFDARQAYAFPEDPRAFDLLLIQKPGVTLREVMQAAADRWEIPLADLRSFLEKYQAFKKREAPYPIHPYVIELAKVLPHFFLMGLGALVFYNQTLGDRPIVSYLLAALTNVLRSTASWLWAAPLALGGLCHLLALFVRIYRYDAPILPREKGKFFLDATFTSLFASKHSALPSLKPGPWWNPAVYEWTGWILRGFGYLVLGGALFALDVPSFATFLVIKGLFGMAVLAEMAAMIGPVLCTLLSKWCADLAGPPARPAWWVRAVNRLNITATRPASPLWLTLKYHFQPSVPTGDLHSFVQAIFFYFLLSGMFFFVGGYLCQQILSLWFTEKYLHGLDWRLLAGGLFFWNTMYLLRYGLFLLASSVASAFAFFPVKMTFAALAAAQIWHGQLHPDQNIFQGKPGLAAGAVLATLAAMLWEPRIVAWVGRKRRTSRPDRKASPESVPSIETQVGPRPSGTLAVVYMSGDDLSHLKLTPAVLLARWRILRDQLDSEGLRWLVGMAEHPPDEVIEERFEKLYAAEKKFSTTLWHPVQLAVSGEKAALARPDLILTVATIEESRELELAWHLRRWLVTMMSTAGHAQDTGINLVDIALRIERGGLAARTVFYLIQNKFDNQDNNRPSQANYAEGELGQRNKLAALLEALAPGSRAFSLQNWTPFGFKAGGLTAMDLVPEASLDLRSMLLLDRNATVHDLDALMEDLRESLANPGMIIVIPGRSTTNTRTPIGQASQLVEEGHRSFLKGLMAGLGGRASEGVGTGWGNILAVFYGRVQRALMDFSTPKMPLTSRMRRGSSFAVRTEGLIGFTPHAVGISEDTWAVSQAAHNAIALGERARFGVSKAMWHKLRETWSHSEWLASFPRWAGGYLQMMHDPLMQQINDFGPVSVFCKEVRANSGRIYMTSIFALFSVMLMPLAIILDLTPFVQILVILWNFGFVMNQVLTLHGLVAHLDAAGFSAVTALAGGALAAGMAALHPPLAPSLTGLAILGFLAGGFLSGLSRWLSTRLRDMILFGPQLILHALGQCIRQTLEFVVSGASPEDARGVNVAFRAWAGPREDRPRESFASPINLRTVIWIAGLASFLLNVFAMSNLDMLNALLLLPSLLFSVSALAGPFLTSPTPGRSLGRFVVIPRLLGWLLALAFYIGLSLMIGGGRFFQSAGLALTAATFFLLLGVALRYFAYRFRWRRRAAALAKILIRENLSKAEAQKVAGELLSQPATSGRKWEGGLRLLGVSTAGREEIASFLDTQVAPLMESAKLPLAPETRATRFRSELGRTFILGLFVFIWFFIVPLPALFVFTAGPYQGSVGLRAIMSAIGLVIAGTLVGFWASQGVDWLLYRSPFSRSLKSQVAALFGRFQALAATRPRPLTPQKVSHAYALFTDLATYVDQQSYDRARHTFRQLREIVETKKP